MLSALPSELLLVIDEFLDFCSTDSARKEHDTTRDRLRFPACCRRFRALLTPKIYECIFLNGSCIWEVSSFTHTIVQSPSIGGRVLSLMLACEECGCTEKTRYESTTIQPVLETMAHTEEELGDWKYALLDDSNPEAWLAIMLPLLSNMVDLSILLLSFPGPHTINMLDRLAQRQRPFDVTPAFSRLETVWVANFTPPHLVVSLFALPSMCRFFNQACESKLDDHLNDTPDPSDESDEGESWETLSEHGWPEPSSSVKHIELHIPGYQTYPDVVSICAKIQTFIYIQENPYWNMNPINAPAMYLSLRRHKDTLETLQISYDWETAINRTRANNSFMGSFSDFTSLKMLHLRAPNIFDWNRSTHRAQSHLADVLPPSLESLILEAVHRCEGKHVLIEQLIDIVGEADSRFPHLEDMMVKSGIVSPLPRYWQQSEGSASRHLILRHSDEGSLSALQFELGYFELEAGDANMAGIMTLLYIIRDTGITVN
ncbi:hypothetical protein BJX61DRAFT_212930 [Aspergillus egyptiacus]|nr:hypothetical protein BJX61DRAFT_212930 [Aspergillus egyptiacus]